MSVISLIELRGYRAGYLTLASLMVIGLGMLWFHATVGHLQLESRDGRTSFLERVLRHVG